MKSELNLIAQEIYKACIDFNIALDLERVTGSNTNLKRTEYFSNIFSTTVTMIMYDDRHLVLLSIKRKNSPFPNICLALKTIEHWSGSSLLYPIVILISGCYNLDVGYSQVDLDVCCRL